MAMLKDVMLPSRVVASYHRIDHMEWVRTPSGFSTQGTVGMYLDEAAANGGEPLATTTFALLLPLETGDPNRSAVYASLTKPVEMHAYEDTGYGDRADGSFGQITVTKSAITESSVTGFNGAPEA